MINNTNLVKVLIPIYKSSISDNERISFNQCLKTLCEYEIELITFQELDLSAYSLSKNISIKYFNKSFFASLQGYNQLMLSWDFYNNYRDYKYILIYQLDAYVFYDKLAYWCLKDYDYIGSPWLVVSKNITFKKWFLSKINWSWDLFRELKIPLSANNQVGNGGFSLRKISKFIDVLEKVDKKILYNYNHSNEVKYNEDVFWSLEIEKDPKLKLNKPKIKEALMFSVDGNPHDLILDMKQLPFGCHGWNKSNQIQNWITIIGV